CRSVARPQAESGAGRLRADGGPEEGRAAAALGDSHPGPRDVHAAQPQRCGAAAHRPRIGAVAEGGRHHCRGPKVKADPACSSVVAALEDDPFYRSISEEFAGSLAERRNVLTRYFASSIEEGRALGRTVHLADLSCGIAVWLLPQPDAIRTKAAERKRLFLEQTLGARGASNYYRMVEYMSGK